MDLNKMLEFLKGMGLDQTKISEAQNLAGKYSPTKEGLLKAINENGGMDMFNKAVKFSENPLFKTALKKFGIDPSVLKTIISQVRGEDSGVSNNVMNDPMKELESKLPKKSTGNDFLDRLNRLK